MCCQTPYTHAMRGLRLDALPSSSELLPQVLRGQAPESREPQRLPLLTHPFETAVMRAVVSGNTPYVCFDR